MKIAYLFIADFGPACHPRLSGDLFFSSRESFNRLYVGKFGPYDQLVEVRVPDDFDDWDFIPDNY